MRDQKLKKRKAYRQGVIAEKIAAFYLRAKGYKILDERFRCRQGEIDLIAQKNRRLVFVEVKARKTIEDGLYSISQKQQNRIMAAAEVWLSQKNIGFDECRFDALLLTPNTLPTHIKNAFMQE